MRRLLAATTLLLFSGAALAQFGPMPGSRPHTHEKYISKVVVQKFTVSGTYRPTQGMAYAVIECLGAGGGGGGQASAAGGTGSSAGGGGSGSYSRATVTAAQIGSSQTVTINTVGGGGSGGNGNGTGGGDASVGTLCVGKGGSGGAGGANGAGGAGGVAGTGDLTLVGNAGGYGSNQAIISIDLATSGNAPSYFGGGSGAVYVAVATAGANGGNYGAGGAGGASWNGGAAEAGGNGGPGIVIITEFLSQ